MQLVSFVAPITIAGIISATLSSALASLVSAPRVFQASQNQHNLYFSISDLSLYTTDWLFLCRLRCHKECQGPDGINIT